MLLQKRNKLSQYIELFRLANRAILLYCIDFLCYLNHPQKPEDTRKKILLVRLDAIGDFVLWLDAVKEIRNHFHSQEYSLTLLGNTLWTPLAETLSYFDFVWDVDRNKFLSNPIYRLKLLSKIRRAGFQVVIHPNYSREFSYGDAVVRISGSVERIGFEGDCSCINPLAKRISDRWYTCLVCAPDITLTELEKNAVFLRELGIKSFKAGLPELPRLDMSVQFYHKDIYVIFPGASNKFKCWPIRRYQELIRLIYKETGWLGVICGGPGEELLGDELLEKAESPLINLAGRTSLAELVSILSHARFLVSNDTCAVHIATGVSTPSVCILGGGHFGRFLPYSLERETNRPLPLVVSNKMDCFKCNWICIHSTPEDEPFPCIASISLDDVWAAVRRVLDRE
jgi:ADP-heptose:LPS heptosyltransferase